MSDVDQRWVEKVLALEAKLTQVKAEKRGIDRAFMSWREAANDRRDDLAAELARVKQERDKWKSQLDRQCRKLADIEEYGQVPARWCLEAQWQRDERTAERDEALRHLEAVSSHNFAFERGSEFPHEAAAREFLSAMREKEDDQ